MAYENPFLMKKNPYLQGAIDSAQDDVVRNYNLTTQPAYNRAMVGSGSFGNQGVQEMNENAQKNMQGSLADISTGMRQQDYRDQQGMYRWDQEFDRNVFNDKFGQNQSTAQMGIGLLGTLNQYNQQDLANATRIQNTPQTYYNDFSNSANVAGRAGQTATSTAGTSSSPMTAALGGAQLGGAFQSWWDKRSNGNNMGTSGNNYSGTSNNYTAPNYENQMDLGYSWGGGA